MKQITIASPNGKDRTIELSPAMQEHWRHPINHGQTILDQINEGMYARWFEGKENLNVIDFGANVGLTALYFLPACKELHVVEPTPAHSDILIRCMKDNINPINDKVVSHYMCLADKEGLFTFMTGHSTENKITTPEGYGNGKIEIQGYPLSYFVNQFTEPVDFIKCDIEGYEINALTIENIEAVAGKVKTFFVECHPSQDWTMDGCVAELNRRFEHCGYEVESVDYQTLVATNTAL